MTNTVLYGNGLNRLSSNAVSWDDLLDELKGSNGFDNGRLPYTMVYERIFMGMHKADEKDKFDELDLKIKIANSLAEQESNEIFELLANMNFENYLTTNYDYAFEKALGVLPEILSTEDIYSLRRKRRYKIGDDVKQLWNIHGEIDNPKSIMLGLDHYCGSLSKIDSYVKGTYKHFVDGKPVQVAPMRDKLRDQEFCHASWIDLFFSSDVHMIGFGMDYSETDLWWLLNKRARFAAEKLVKNEIYFYSNYLDNEKIGLLESFGVNVVLAEISSGDYKSMYRATIEKMLPLSVSVRAA
ncbi:SIR2 family protein [Pseudomonas orientalis]|uniref:SIR2 family protein n=1 Tax=Pseudomonas orientalis TaxID=76758 RepID=UPI001022A2D2|nr:SIR2 family protein [Pseudomonas orientalis]RZI25128.1 hypothetical protein EUX53_09575 [Pseudomonas orientalis]